MIYHTQRKHANHQTSNADYAIHCFKKLTWDNIYNIYFYHIFRKCLSRWLNWYILYYSNYIGQRFIPDSKRSRYQQTTKHLIYNYRWRIQLESSPSVCWCSYNIHFHIKILCSNHIHWNLFIQNPELTRILYKPNIK